MARTSTRTLRPVQHPTTYVATAAKRFARLLERAFSGFPLREHYTAAFVAASLAWFVPLAAYADTTVCKLQFALGGWDAHFRESVGTGTIACDNGERADVAVAGHDAKLAQGAGVLGPSTAVFSPVLDISAVLGTFALPPAAAIANHRTGGVAEAMTNGQATLTFALTGSGSTIPSTFGHFVVRAR